jgi:hypothetical protein
VLPSFNKAENRSKNCNEITGKTEMTPISVVGSLEKWLHFLFGEGINTLDASGGRMTPLLS